MRLRAKVAGFIREPFHKDGQVRLRSRMIEAGEVFELEPEQDSKGKPVIPAWSEPVEGDSPKG